MAETQLAKLTGFDTADYLTEPETIRSYIAETLKADGITPIEIVAALATVARAFKKTDLAKEVHLSREGLYNALSPAGNPSFVNVVNIADAMGFKITFTEKPAAVAEKKPTKGRKKHSSQHEMVAA